MEESKSRISRDIIRSFRKNLYEDVMFMCLYTGETDGGIVTNERPFTGKETIDLLSASDNVFLVQCLWPNQSI
jgi:hypothetical protein